MSESEVGAMEEDTRVCSASDTGSTTSLKHVSQLNSGITSKERFKT